MHRVRWSIVRQPEQSLMGTWGTGLYSDDLASDLRADFKDLIGDGLSPEAALDQLKREHAAVLKDQDEEPVFWLALADTAWKLGLLPSELRDRAINVIESGRDAKRWDDPKNRDNRDVVLAKLREQLLSAPPSPKRVAKRIRAANNWEIGEIVAFQLLSGRWTALRVIGHHEDKGGRSAVCEPLDWIGDAPTVKDVYGLAIRNRRDARHTVSQFLFQEPRTKRDCARVVRTGLRSMPAQLPGSFTVFVWPHVDRLFRELYGLE